MQFEAIQYRQEKNKKPEFSGRQQEEDQDYGDYREENDHGCKEAHGHCKEDDRRQEDNSCCRKEDHDHCKEDDHGCRKETGYDCQEDYDRCKEDHNDRQEDDECRQEDHNDCQEDNDRVDADNDGKEDHNRKETRSACIRKHIHEGDCR